MNKMLREKMLAYIDGLASNDDLMKLCSILRNGKDAEKLTIAALNAFVPVDVPESEPEAVTAPEPERQNVNPGWTACTRIGTTAKDKIHGMLRHASFSAKTIQESLGKNTGDTCALLQLLWDRGEIKFDGQEFYK